jgi:predicted O-linked N-acetylglucosamine transferase (SPINDLY family)
LASDVLLDPLEWSGGKTSLEAVSCGLPAVTCPGRFMRGRHTYAILKMMGVLETIAEDKSDYIRIAVRLHHDPLLLRSIRQQVKDSCGRLFRDRVFMDALENFYTETAHQGERMLRH